MKQGWTYRQLGDVCEILDSKRKPITKGKREPGSIPYYGATGCLDYVKDYIFDEKLVLLGEDGAKWGPGENSAYIISGKSWVNNHAHALRPKREILLDKILVYYLNYSNLQTFITGVTVPKLNQEKMRSIEVPVAPISEQERIVERLDAAFAQIEELKSNAEKQLAEARALFQSVMLITFAQKAGWKSVKLGDICKIKSGSSTANNSSSGNLPYVKVSDMNIPENSEFITTSTRFVDRDENEKGIFPVGSVIFPKRGGAILTNKKRLTKVEICCDLNIMGLVSKDTSVLNNDFLFQWFKQFDLSSVTSGTTVLQLNNCDITPVNIALPPLSIQKSIVEYLNDFSTRIRSLEVIFNKSLAECDAMKQALLRQIFE